MNDNTKQLIARAQDLGAELQELKELLEGTNSLSPYVEVNEQSLRDAIKIREHRISSALKTLSKI